MSINTGPAYGAESVTPHDSNGIAETRALYIGGAGDVKVDMANGDDTAITFSAVPAGTILPIRVIKVYDTDTDATNILALY